MLIPVSNAYTTSILQQERHSLPRFQRDLAICNFSLVQSSYKKFGLTNLNSLWFEIQRVSGEVQHNKQLFRSRRLLDVSEDLLIVERYRFVISVGLMPA